MSDRPPVVRSPERTPWERLEVGCRAELRPVIGPERSATLGAGIVRLTDCEFEWSLNYDEILYVLGGTMEVEHEGALLRAEPGQVLLVPKGSEVTYRGVGECTAFYATYPVNWEEAQANG